MSQVGTSLPAFDDASSGISGLTNTLSNLVDAFTSLAEMPIMTADAFSAGIEEVITNIESFAKALEDNIATIEKSLEAMDNAWTDYAANINLVQPIFKDAVAGIATLITSLSSLIDLFQYSRQCSMHVKRNDKYGDEYHICNNQ
jgi:ABC-type transporter Mla subunit MlaD